MYDIAETNLLLRERIELPVGLKLATEEFGEGWNLVKAKDARMFEKRVLRRGWKFIKMVDGWLRSGVGETPQSAIASALRLSLRHVSPHFNSVEVNHIEWTQYPWFYLARVMVNPYRIQQGEIMPVPDETSPRRVILRCRLPRDTAEMFPGFCSSMPMVKEMLVISRSSQMRVQ
jgi:hypothetical protein